MEKRAVLYRRNGTMQAEYSLTVDIEMGQSDGYVLSSVASQVLVRRAEEKSAEEWVRQQDRDETRVTLRDNSFLEWETT